MGEVADRSIVVHVDQPGTRPASGDGAAVEPQAQPCLLNTTERTDIEALPDGELSDVVNVRKINDVPKLNAFFASINEKLAVGGVYTGCVCPAAHVKQQILNQYPYGLAWLYYLVFFMMKRVLPKLRVTQGLYAFISGGKGRVLSKTEVLGRLVYNGFDIVDCREVGGELFYTAEKVRPPERGSPPSYGLIFKMKRVGQGGRPVYIYKFRTMHPYADYLQAYIHGQNDLQSNGKFKDDFRVATWGKFMRKLWIDELPMLLNWIRRDIKLVGVRPLSEQYLSLYPEDLLRRRLRHTPGLLPPFYADLPEGFEAILESEARYLEAWEKSPFRTDLRYLRRILYNIIVRRARSQ